MPKGWVSQFPSRPGVLFQIKASHPNQGLLDHCPSDLLLLPLTGSQSAKPPVGAKFGLEGVIVRKQSLGSFKCSTEIHVSTMKRASSSPQEVLVGAALFLSRWLNWILPWSRLKKRRLTLARIGTLNPNQPSRNLGCFALERGPGLSHFHQGQLLQDPLLRLFATPESRIPPEAKLCPTDGREALEIATWGLHVPPNGVCFPKPRTPFPKEKTTKWRPQWRLPFFCLIVGGSPSNS